MRTPIQYFPAKNIHEMKLYSEKLVHTDWNSYSNVASSGSRASIFIGQNQLLFSIGKHIGKNLGEIKLFQGYCFSQARKFSMSFHCREMQKQLQLVVARISHLRKFNANNGTKIDNASSNWCILLGRKFQGNSSRVQ